MKTDKRLGGSLGFLKKPQKNKRVKGKARQGVGRKRGRKLPGKGFLVALERLSLTPHKDYTAPHVGEQFYKRQRKLTNV